MKNEVYIDETGIQTQMYRQYARSPRGKRGNIRICGKRHARIGLVAAQCEGKLIAPLMYTGAMKSQLFEKCFEQELLKELPYGSVRIMDNASFHRNNVLYETIKNPRIH